MTENSLKQKENKSGFVVGRIILSVVLLLAFCIEGFAQSYEFSLNPRRLGNQLGVEVWIRTLDPAAPALGDMTIPVLYNMNFLTGAEPGDRNQPSSKTDAVYNSPDMAPAPLPYYVIESACHNANGFNTLVATVTESSSIALATLSTRLQMQGAGGIKPAETERGTFVGMLRFNIRNANALSDNDLAGFEFSLGGHNLGYVVINDYNGNRIANSEMEFVTPEAFTIRGITVLSPNTSQTINRYPAAPYASMGTNLGYPVYFERSGLATPDVAQGAYGTQRYAYAIEYSLDDGLSYTETGRVAESRLRNAQMTTPEIQNANFSGMVDYPNASMDYYITTGSARVIPADVATPDMLRDEPDGPGLRTNGYGGVLRIIWKADANFPFRSENARLRITQIATAAAGSNTNLNEDSRPIYDDATRQGVTPASFVLGRVFFVQLNGECQYLRTQRAFNNANNFTVEAWINLNANNEGGQPGIVASSFGSLSSQEGIWMLYLENGVYPAFRVRADDSTVARTGNPFLAQIVSPQPLNVYSMTDINGNIIINELHSRNWTHVAAVVRNSLVTLYIDGEEVANYVNTSPNARAAAYSGMPIWVGVNPNNSFESGIDFLYAGVKEVKVWSTALNTAELRQYISGVPFPTRATDTSKVLGTIQGDPKASLTIYANLQGVLSDLASEGALQDYASPFRYFTTCETSVGAVANNDATVFRPDGSHIKLTSPSCGEGVSNLKGKIYEVRWASYGIGSSLPTPDGGTGDVMIQVSRDGGANWFDAIGPQKYDSLTKGTFAVSLDNEEGEYGSAFWEPYNNVTLTSIANDIQGLLTTDNNYAKTVRLRISGTEGNMQQDIYAESGDFTVAPFFALENKPTSRITVPGNSRLNVTTATAFMEAWIRPNTFPAGDDANGTYPIIVKKDPNALNDDDGLHYAFRLLADGRLEFAFASYDSLSDTRETRYARSGRVIPQPYSRFDQVWYHVGVYLSFPQNGTASSITFFIDGVPDETDSIRRQLGEGIVSEIRNAYPTYLGYEPFGATEYTYFDGAMKEFRFWRGNPGGFGTRTTEYGTVELYDFIQGASTIRAEELIQVGSTNYSQGLIAAYSMSGGSWVNDGADGTIAAYPRDAELRAQIFGSCADGGRVYVATEPYIKLVEPVSYQMVGNTDTVRVRWVGFDYNRNDVNSFTPGTITKPADLGVDIGGGGNHHNRTYPPVASIFENTSFANAMILPKQVNPFEFQGTASKSQFAALLNMGGANSDVKGDVSYDEQGPIAPAQNGGRLELFARASLNSPEPLEFANVIVDLNGTSQTTFIEGLRSIGPVFSITPPSNFTVRVLLEGYHQGLNREMVGQLGNTFEANALRIRFYEDNGNEPGVFVANTIAISRRGGYSSDAKDPANRNGGSNTFANVPFTLTEAMDRRYFVVLDHQNYLPLMSAFSAPFYYTGDNFETWVIESGWDFQGWDGTNGSYITQGQASVEPIQPGFTFTAYADGGTVTANRFSGEDQTAWTRTPLNFNEGHGAVDFTPFSMASMVGGDVVRDGIINSADRAAIGRAASMAGSPQLNLKGYGAPNAIDRTIVDINTDKVSPLFDIQNGAIMEQLGYPPLMEGGIISERNDDIELTPADIVDIEARIANFWNTKNSESLQSGINYKVSATVDMSPNHDYVDVSVFIANSGEQWALANASFPIEFDPAVLRFNRMLQYDNVVFSNNTDAGYGATYYGPSEIAKDPISNVYSIEVNFDANPRNRRHGVNVPHTKTYLGTLRFDLMRNDASIFFKWSSFAAVLAVDGRDLTRDGNFEDIKPIIVEKEVELIQPNGGEQFAGGSATDILWQGPLLNTSLRLEYSTNGGSNWTLINSAPVQLTTYKYQWILPYINSSQCLVRVVDVTTDSVLAKSKNIFSIRVTPTEITRPSASDPTYAANTQDYIEWVAGVPEDIFFEYSENGINGWTRVTGVVNANLGRLLWTIPSSNTCNAVIRMIRSSDGTVLVTSDPFTVSAGKVAITSPAKGNGLIPGSNTQIRWNASGLTTFDLEVSMNAGAHWESLVKGVNASTRVHNWKVPSVTSSNVIIRAVNATQTCLEYGRTGLFKIENNNTSVDELVGGNLIASITPNPVSDDATILFNIANNSTVSIAIYDVIGNKVLNVISHNILSAGSHDISFNVAGLSSGVYVVRMHVGNSVVTKEFVKVK